MLSLLSSCLMFLLPVKGLVAVVVLRGFVVQDFKGCVASGHQDFTGGEWSS